MTIRDFLFQLQPIKSLKVVTLVLIARMKLSKLFLIHQRTEASREIITQKSRETGK